MPQPLIYHIDVNSAFLSWEAAELLRQDPDAPDIRSFPSVIGGSEKTQMCIRDRVTVVMSYAEGWTKVKWNGETGYIKTSLLQ